MSKKKIHSIIVGIMLVSVALAVLPSASAASPRTVRGYVYVDGNLTTPDEVKLIISDQEVIATIPGDPVGYYILDFSEENEEKGIFHVTITEGTWEAAETIIIEHDYYPNFNLTINTSHTPVNEAPYTPSNPNPTNGNVNINADLSWTGGDPDGDTVTYDVYFGTTNPPLLKKENHPSTSYDPGTMGYSTTYYWQIIAEDEHGATSTGPIWNFTTKPKPEEPPNGDGAGGGGVIPPPNLSPVANAGGPYAGVTDELITFDGSGSNDPDGDIVSWEWDFGDDSTGSGQTTTHIYSSAGTYTVTLKVTDDGGKADTDTTTATISQFNNPPTIPVVSGPQTGDIDTDYEYTAVSTDLDNDTIQYMFDWDDGTNTTTDFVANGTTVNASHNWLLWGIYTISVTAYDNNATSDTKDYVVLIDVIWVKNIGYLIDTDSDGITYDSFYSNETGTQTEPEKQDDGTYLINSDGIEGWDWVYDPQTDTLTPYSAPSEADYTWLYALIIVIIILLLIAAAAMGKKKKKKQKPKKPKK